MQTADDVIEGARAHAWGRTIGRFGDPIRMSMVNDLVARALTYFKRLPSTARIARPHRLLQEALADLPVLSDKSILDQVPELTAWHENSAALAQRFPTLDGASLLDLGCGNGYLGGWLAENGVSYVGVEPSLDLMKLARDDERLSESSLIQRTIRQFCDEDLYPSTSPPTLITIIAVLDHLSEPEDTLRSLFAFLARRGWLNVPILALSFDPDFFVPGLPARAVQGIEADSYGEREELRLRDPAEWEEIFSVTGFHLLEQRPVHISALPHPLAEHLQRRHSEVFADDIYRVPPRQGPFFFWLFCPRMMMIESKSSQPLSGDSLIDIEIQSYPTDEVLDVVGNLGSKLYHLQKGEAYFESPDTKRMTFARGDFFGQLETSGNYVSSRILGHLEIKAGSCIETARNRDILRHLSTSGNLSNHIFLSMLRHFDSVRFVPFLSPKRKTRKRTTEVFSSTSYDMRDVRNYAACLLHACSKAVANPLSGRYRSRILVELSDWDIKRLVHGPQADREDDVLKVGPSFVQANVIDCFSPFQFEQDRLEPDIREFTDDPKGTHAPMHVGWQAASYLEFHFPGVDADGSGDDIYPLALAISALLGSDRDTERFRSDFYDRVRHETDEPPSATEPKLESKKCPKGAEAICDFIVGQIVSCSDEGEAYKVRAFLSLLLNHFRFKAMGDYHRKLGLSDLVIVRDIWALVACVLDEPELWEWSAAEEAPGPYMRNPNQTPRLVAYLQECIGYLGEKAGFSTSPW